MTDLALSALTDVILACEMFFIAGLSFRPDVQRGSAAWLWAVSLLLVGLSTMFGAIDHGFFEGVSEAGHDVMVRATRVTVAIATFTMLMANALQFFGPTGRKIAAGIGGIGLVVVVAGVTLSDNFLFIIGSYSLVLLLMLGLHLKGLRNGTGSLALCLGIVLMIGASLLPVMGSQGIPALGLYGTYHVLLMPAVIGLYLGGRVMRRTK